MDNSSSLQAAARAAAYVTQLAIAVIFGAWVGDQADVWFHTSPGFLLLGLCIGSVGGFVILIRGFQPSQSLPSDTETGPDDPS